MDEHGRFYGDCISRISEKAVPGQNTPSERYGIFETDSCNFSHF